ncbi:hypothetical protein CR513_63064, partial [Mucuna pruriens]
MSEHLVCRHTPHISHANILSPSSSLAPQLHSTVHLSSPRSIRNLLNPFFPMHLPLTQTTSFDPNKSLTWVESQKASELSSLQDPLSLLQHSLPSSEDEAKSHINISSIVGGFLQLDTSSLKNYCSLKSHSKHRLQPRV